jgi:hypothetical protein
MRDVESVVSEPPAAVDDSVSPPVIVPPADGTAEGASVTADTVSEYGAPATNTTDATRAWPPRNEPPDAADHNPKCVMVTPAGIWKVTAAAVLIPLEAAGHVSALRT